VEAVAELQEAGRQEAEVPVVVGTLVLAVEIMQEVRVAQTLVAVAVEHLILVLLLLAAALAALVSSFFLTP
jgi:uncharacterized membrane protein YwzB